MALAVGVVRSFLTDKMLEEDNPKKIGSIIYFIYNTYSFGDPDSVIINADGISGDQLLMLDTILEGDHDYELEEGAMVVTIEHILLEEKFNTEENEKKILEEFIKYCQYMMFDYLAIAISSGNVIDKKTIVLKFPQLKMYEDLNFVNIGGYNKKTDTSYD